jgi:hypothetical protein
MDRGVCDLDDRHRSAHASALVPVLGWNGVLGSVYAWVALLLQPWMFAIILLAVKRLMSALQRDAG